MSKILKKVLGVFMIVGSMAALAQVVEGVIYEFTGGDVTNQQDAVTQNIDGDANRYTAKQYVENGIRMRVEGGTISIGDYYGGGNAVIHGHWSDMQKVIFEAESGEAFDLNYYKLTSNPLPGQGGAGGDAVVSIIASKDGVTESFRSVLPDENWGDELGGDKSVQEVYLGPEFDGIKAFWFESDKSQFKCFGMDTFYINKAPPPPSTDDAIIVGSGTVEDAVNETPAAPAVPVPSLTFFALLLMGILLGYAGVRQLIG